MDYLYKIKSLWPIPNHFSIPTDIFTKEENQIFKLTTKPKAKPSFLNIKSIMMEIDENFKVTTTIKNNKEGIKESFTYPILDSHIVEYIFTFSNEANLNRYTSHSSVYLLERLIKKSLLKKDFELNVLTCLYISSKLFNSNQFEIGELHKLSGNTYSNSDILNHEKYIISSLGYNVINRDELLLDKAGVVLEMVKNIIIHEVYSFLYDLVGECCDLIYESQYFRFIDVNFNMFLSIGIVNCSFVILTKTTGTTPLLYRLSQIGMVSIEDIVLLTEKLLKFILGNEVYKKYNF